MFGLGDVKTVADLVEKAFSFSADRKADRAEDFEKYVRTGHEKFLELAASYLRAMKAFGGLVHTCSSDSELNKLIAEFEMDRVEIIVERSQIFAKFQAISEKLDIAHGEVSKGDVPKIELQGYIQDILEFFYLASRVGRFPVTGVTSILDYVKFARSRDIPLEEICQTCEFAVNSMQHVIEIRLDSINRTFEKITGDAATYLDVLQSR